jgi:biuret amidohydrolase
MEGSVNPLARLASAMPRYTVAPRKTALLTIDMQYLDAHPDWGLGRKARELGLGEAIAPYFQRVREITGRIQRLQEAVRRGGGEVVHIALGALTPDRRDACPRHYLLGLSPARGSKEAEFIDELRPDPADVVLHKTSASPFNSTAIDQILHNLGVELLVVAGVLTNGCVESTVRDAGDRSFQVILVEDACAALADELHRNSIRNLEKTFCNVWTTEEVLEAFSAGAR